MFDFIHGLFQGAEKLIFGVERTIFADVLGIAGMCVSFVMLISPLPSVLKGINDKKLPSLSSNYFLLAILNSILWANYGFKEMEFAIFLTNTFAYFMFLFYFNSSLYINGDSSYMIPYTLLSMTISALTFFFVNKEVVGILALIMSSLWMLSSIEKMREALHEKNSDFLNLPVILSSMLGNLIWLNYGLVLKDFYVVFPNALGFVLYFCNLIIYLWTTDRINEDNFAIGFMKNAFLAKSDTPSGSTKEKRHKLK